MVLQVAVIGAGASGLVTLKYLLEAHKFFPGVDIEARLFEKDDDLGGVFQNQVYEDAELVSSKYLTAFSDFRIPENERDFLTPQKYVDYLKAYATRFGLWGHIHFSTAVASIEPSTDNKHVLSLVDAQGQHVETYSCHAVAVCSGLNQDPFLPDIAGLTVPLRTADQKQSRNTQNKKLEDVSIHPHIEAIHSVNFKARSQFGFDKTVLVMGAGETGMDVAHLAITSPTKRVIICHRDGFIHAPKIVPEPYRAGGRSGGPDPNRPNKPLDCAIASLFDTAYLPAVLQRSSLPWAVYDAFIKDMAWVISGTRAGFDQWAGGVSWERFHADSLLICKSDRAMPYISEQYRSKSMLNKWRGWLLNMELKPTGGKKIDLAPWPTHVDEDGVVHFEKNNRPESEKMQMEKGIKPDLVVFATGYKQSFPFLPTDVNYPSLDDLTTRGIYRNIEDGIAYIGFIRPAFGAIPPVAEVQAQHWVYHLLACPRFRSLQSPNFMLPCRSPDTVAPYDLDYKLKCRDKNHNFSFTKRAVDQESYVYQLAVDMGSAPTWTYVLRRLGTDAFLTWAMGPNFTTKFRLVGPWSNEESRKMAARLMGRDGELGVVVRRTGGGVFLFTYTIIPLILFAPISIFINVLSWLASGIGYFG
ncbi:Dimethylaniline monooxygenase [N-oxide-forming] 1 [Cytospora mali]|uniref:Dimethylaniline monooxygenase [N-oxide-forming] 1 n=1 Tax=Cytospora mali TaxID=578113 RepID=A0A194VV85_CYTMA|nr:Dimethylaniline monooxygenase [N-oxide-forming] 1 [Valsa mali]